MEEKKTEIMDKFSDLVVQLYEAKDRMLDDLDAGFNRRNEAYEKTLKEEKIWFSEGLNIKDQCRQTAMWYKYACDSWDKSNKSVQEYIQQIGNLERRKNTLVTKKNDLEKRRNIFGIRLLYDSYIEEFTTLLPEIDYIEFNEDEEHLEYPISGTRIKMEDVFSHVRKAAIDVAAISLATNYPINNITIANYLSGFIEEEKEEEEGDVGLDLFG